MFPRMSFLVRAVLPVLPLVLCQACSSGAASDSPTAAAPSSSNSTTPPASANNAPTINRVGDEYAKVGETYSYQPIAGDAEGDTLQFSAVNLPPWASMDPTSGHISGTPGPADEGVYEAITITVADAAHKAVTAPFTITVLADAAVTGVASLQWDLPMSKVDGSPLDDLAGFRILYGRDSNNLDRSVLISNPSATSYEFSALPSGIWYFAVVGVNSAGLEGPPTITAMKSI
jgi:hypothetical protein